MKSTTVSIAIACVLVTAPSLAVQKTVRYEVAITKNGKTSEIAINGDGSIHKR